MNWPTLETYDRISNREDENSDSTIRRGFEESYLGMRLVIGVVGVALPSLLVVVDVLLLEQPISVRGSMSAYYHTSARDVFVGGLAVSGVMLMTYMFWKWWTWDFVLSFIAGVGVLGVAAFPTARQRPDNASGPPDCSDELPGQPMCTALQNAWGEAAVRKIHLVATVVVVLSFMAMCLVFALRDFGYGRGAREVEPTNPPALGPRRVWQALHGRVLKHVWTKAPRTVLYLLCLLGVFTGAVWAMVGQDWLVPNGYGGELIAFTAFATAWIIASWDLLKGLVQDAPVAVKDQAAPVR